MLLQRSYIFVEKVKGVTPMGLFGGLCSLFLLRCHLSEATLFLCLPMNTQPLFHNKRELYGIILICFVAPTFYFIFSNCTFLAFDRCIIGFTNSKPSAFGVLGCPPHSWMHVARSFMMRIIFTTLALLGYFISNKGGRTQHFYYLLLGAILFFPAVHFTGVWAANFVHSPFWFLEHKQRFMAIPLPILGNFYYYRWVEFGVSVVLIYLYIYCGFKILFNHWSLSQRISLLFFGSIACLLGYLCWFFGLGPFLFPFTFHH